MDYVSAWFFKFAEYATSTSADCAFVSTNSIVQGEQVARLWPLILAKQLKIFFAHTSFKWSNLASDKAGVTVVIIGLTHAKRDPLLFDLVDGNQVKRRVANICPYLVAYQDIFVETSTNSISKLTPMLNGNKPADGGHLLLSSDEVIGLIGPENPARKYVRPFLGGDDTIHGKLRDRLWISEAQANEATKIPWIADRIDRVRKMRLDMYKEFDSVGEPLPHSRFSKSDKPGKKQLYLCLGIRLRTENTSLSVFKHQVL